MFDKLEDLLIRFEEIMGELGEPTVTNNQERFRSLMKEQSDLTPIVEAYKEYKKCKQDIEDSLMMLEEESDEDLRELAKEELAEAKKEIEELCRMTVEEFRAAEKLPLVIVLDNVRSMHNIGSVFRTSDAYVVEKVVLCGITAQPPHPDIHKSALGAEFSVDWEYYADTNEAVSALKAQGYEVWAIELAENSVMLQDFFNRTIPHSSLLIPHFSSNPSLSTSYSTTYSTPVTNPMAVSMATSKGLTLTATTSPKIRNTPHGTTLRQDSTSTLALL